jgi:hypothetical protein
VDYAKQYNFDPLNPQNWYAQPRDRIMEFQVFHYLYQFLLFNFLGFLFIIIVLKLISYYVHREQRGSCPITTTTYRGLYLISFLIFNWMRLNFHGLNVISFSFSFNSFCFLFLFKHFLFLEPPLSRALNAGKLLDKILLIIIIFCRTGFLLFVFLIK